MNFLRRLFNPGPEPREALRPLWFATVVAAREPRWYADLGVADTVEGRFDMITMILALAVLRLEREPDQVDNTARLTELFIEDMDAQLRQSGVGDLVVGKHIGKLMATLGGRLGALRESLPQGAPAVAAVVARNVSLVDGADALPVAEALIVFRERLATRSLDQLMAGEL